MNPRVSPIRRQRRRIVSSGWLARTAPRMAAKKGAAGCADAQRRADHVHRSAAEDGDGGDRRVAEGQPQRGHRAMKRAVAAVHGDDRRRVGAQRDRFVGQLFQRLGGEHAAVSPEQCLELRRHPGVASVRARARVDEERDRGQSSPPGPSSPLSSSPGASASAAAASAAAAILGYHCSNTSAIWRACFSFEMLNEDCLR